MIAKALASALCCFALLLSGCGSKSVSDVAGSYEGSYFGGRETFTLNSLESFTQIFEVGGTNLYTNHGTWLVTNRTIYFRGFLQAYWFTNTNFSKYRDPIEVEASIPMGTSAILFNDAGDHFVRKK